MTPQKLVLASAGIAIAAALTVHAFAQVNHKTENLDTVEQATVNREVKVERENSLTNRPDPTRSWLETGECPGCNLQGANLQGTDLAYMNLQGANLQGANLQGANLQGANLQGANLQGATLNQADLERANLAGANLSHTSLWQANLDQAVLEHTNFEGADLDQATLKTADGECTDVQFSMDADESGAKIQFHLDSQATNTRSQDSRVDINVNANDHTATMRVNALGCEVAETVNSRKARMPGGSIHP